MTRYTRNGLLGLMMAGMTACTGAVGGGTGSGSAGNGGPGTAGNPVPGSAGNTGPGTAGNTGPGSGGSTVTGTGGSTGGTGYVEMPCVPGIPATTQLRRMQNWQYDATVRDLLGVTTVDVGAGAQAAVDPALRRLRRPDGSRRVPHLQGRRRGDRQGRHGQRDPEGQVHHAAIRPRPVPRDDLPDQHDQDASVARRSAAR